MFSYCLGLVMFLSPCSCLSILVLHFAISWKLFAACTKLLCARALQLFQWVCGISFVDCAQFTTSHNVSLTSWTKSLEQCLLCASDNGFDTVFLHTIFPHRFKLLLAVSRMCFNTTLVCKQTWLKQLLMLLHESNCNKRKCIESWLWSASCKTLNYNLKNLAISWTSTNH